MKGILNEEELEEYELLKENLKKAVEQELTDKEYLFKYDQKFKWLGYGAIIGAICMFGVWAGVLWG